MRRDAAGEGGGLGLPGEDEEEGAVGGSAQQEFQPAQGEFVAVLGVVEGQHERAASQYVGRVPVQGVERLLDGGSVRG
ncbi:hypothetical protein SALB_02227 [Streptomyces noursei]|uniref:Uncharacterized protein n=1 Tax=Streptomyces noursei TaxID=1971 RepID=A0A401QW03_STRNR|nr:hypothetical protein SALB_02227 [Streptomyces noursei]